MSHYNIAVIIPSEGDVKASVAGMMQAFYEGNDDFDYPEPCDYHTFLHWDWFRIGGRWDGEILGGQPECLICERDSHHHYTDAHEQVERNCVPIRELCEDFHAWGVLEPSGDYHCRFVPGDSFNSMNEDEWFPLQDSIINRYLDHRIVTVDIHT